MAAITHFPKSRLSEIIASFGGVSRDDAIAAAAKAVEANRGESDAMIERAISALEGVASAAEKEGHYTPTQMKEVLEISDQVITIAGVYNYPILDAATRSLCDITDGLMRAGQTNLASIRVHIRALRMLAPTSVQLAPEHIELVLSELARVLAHHGFSRLSEAAEKSEPDQGKPPGS